MGIKLEGGNLPWESIYAPEREGRKTPVAPPEGWVWSVEDKRWVIDEAAGFERDPKTRKAIKKSELSE